MLKSALKIVEWIWIVGFILLAGYCFYWLVSNPGEATGLVWLMALAALLMFLWYLFFDRIEEKIKSAKKPKSPEK